MQARGCGPACFIDGWLLSAYYHWMLGHQSLQLFMHWGVAQPGQQAQYQQKVFVWINAVGRGRFYQRVHNGAGFRTLHDVAEQPVLSAYGGLLLQLAELVP